MMFLFVVLTAGLLTIVSGAMEQNINDYLAGDSIAKGESLTELNPSNPPAPLSVRLADGGEASQRRP